MINSFVFNIQPSNNFLKKKLIKMEYEKFKNYDEIINFLPSFQASIIINNWLSYIENNKNNENNEKDNDIDFRKHIYNMKVYISINKEKTNNIILAWAPEYTKKRMIAYIVSGQIANNTLYLERIAQNPYYQNIIDLKFIDLLNELNKVINNSKNIYNLNLDELNNYDYRYKLSLLVEQDI